MFRDTVHTRTYTPPPRRRTGVMTSALLPRGCSAGVWHTVERKMRSLPTRVVRKGDAHMIDGMQVRSPPPPHTTGRNAAQRGFHPTRNLKTGWCKVPPAVLLSPAVPLCPRVSAGMKPLWAAIHPGIPTLKPEPRHRMANFQLASLDLGKSR